jgi:putative Mn2+ efflux pump MntP
MDAFALALSYGINGVKTKKIIITAITVGLFHFFMPLLGNFIGISLFEYTIFKPKYILFLVFLMLSIDMFAHFFEEKPKIRRLNVLGIILFAISVSFDSFSVGIGINYIYDNILLTVLVFCIISSFFTLFGFLLGKCLSIKVGKYSFLLGSITLFIYSILMLTN